MYQHHTNLLRISSIIGPGAPIPVSRSTWWAGVKSGRFPKPVRLGPRLTAWKTSDIQKLVEDGIPTQAGKKLRPGRTA